MLQGVHVLTLLHSERPKLFTVLAFLSAIGLSRQCKKNMCLEHNLTSSSIYSQSKEKKKKNIQLALIECHSDQPGHPCSQIKVFPFHIYHL